MASDGINITSRWYGDCEKAMIIDMLTSKIESLGKNFDSEWKNHYN